MLLKEETIKHLLYMVTNALKDITGETKEHNEATNNNNITTGSWRCPSPPSWSVERFVGLVDQLRLVAGVGFVHHWIEAVLLWHHIVGQDWDSLGHVLVHHGKSVGRVGL